MNFKTYILGKTGKEQKYLLSELPEAPTLATKEHQHNFKLLHQSHSTFLADVLIFYTPSGDKMQYLGYVHAVTDDICNCFSVNFCINFEIPQYSETVS